MDLIKQLVFLSTFLVIVDCTPPTCYSSVLNLSKRIMKSLKRLQTFAITKPCVAILPNFYIDVHNSCVMIKLRDHLYFLDNLSSPRCQKLSRITWLKVRIRRLYKIINQVCYRDLVFFTDDCAALENPPPTQDPQEELLN
ncbi:cytokine-like protein 1 [Callorhinchus milii]|uniref:Cytokine-like protein 1 n=1 Tax=Callorhinchus milii TaxID=7868 RepID=V9LHK0_CALMI|nr:cytokine-like protein 1 [Callorhinchus milii]|eukprot:gi/632959246/ref/XP_007895506.1/ PREDICTED: cytokine-like protein 1 [Callorhinchus milii]